MMKSRLRTAIAHSGKMKITKTVIIALRNAIPTPNASPNELRARMSPPAPSCARPAINQNQPQPVMLIPKSTSLAREVNVSSSATAAIPLKKL